MNKLCQRMVSLALTGALCVSMGATAFAAGSNNPLSSSETWTDEEGNSVKLVYSVEDSSSGADSHAALYVNGVLTQESYVSPKSDTVDMITVSLPQEKLRKVMHRLKNMCIPTWYKISLPRL